jgi:plastocyanin
MYGKSHPAMRYVMLCAFLCVVGPHLDAAELHVTVNQADGKPFAGAVVSAEPSAPAPRGRKALATIDQRDLMFVPDIIVVRTGTDIEFPNSDRVRHQVYSFSGAKTFQLSLYAGRQHEPINFDKPGLVTLGCNIHA